MRAVLLIGSAAAAFALFLFVAVSEKGTSAGEHPAPAEMVAPPQDFVRAVDALHAAVNRDLTPEKQRELLGNDRESIRIEVMALPIKPGTNAPDAFAPWGGRVVMVMKVDPEGWTVERENRARFWKGEWVLPTSEHIIERARWAIQNERPAK